MLKKAKQLTKYNPVPVPSSDAETAHYLDEPDSPLSSVMSIVTVTSSLEAARNSADASNSQVASLDLTLHMAYPINRLLSQRTPPGAAVPSAGVEIRSQPNA